MMLPTILEKTYLMILWTMRLKETSSAAETRCMANTAKTL